jgi:hypothetical protein
MTCRTQYSIDNIIHGTAICAVQHFSFESSTVRFDEGYRPSLHERFRRRSQKALAFLLVSAPSLPNRHGRTTGTSSWGRDPAAHHQRSFIAPAIDRKQTAHRTIWPDAPLNLKPGVSNSIAPSVCRSKTTNTKATVGAPGRTNDQAEPSNESDVRFLRLDGALLIPPACSCFIHAGFSLNLFHCQRTDGCRGILGPCD